jgi:hypothetical protein
MRGAVAVVGGVGGTRGGCGCVGAGGGQAMWRSMTRIMSKSRMCAT